MFIGGSLTLNARIESSAISPAAKAAWRRLRYEVPELGVEADQAYMQYRVPSDEHEVNEWILRTTNFEYGDQQFDFRKLLDFTRLKKVDNGADQAFLNLYCQDGLVDRVDFMLNADHQIVDGIGIRILLGRLLDLLAVSLSSPREEIWENFRWEESTKNLSPPWIGVMNGDQLISGSEYEERAKANRDFVFEKMPQNPGLPLLSAARTAVQKNRFIILTAEQSTKLLSTVKHVIGPSSNITHLAHAAMVLALLRAYTPGPNPKTLYSPCWLNGRRYLRHITGQPDPEASYLPICQSFGPVIFPNLDDLVLPLQASRNEIKDKLIGTCRTATEEYAKIRARKSMLPDCVLLFEEIGRNMQQKLNGPSEDLPVSPLSRNPESIRISIPDSPSVVSDTEETLPSPKTADPFLLSDGVTEKYISHSYFDSKRKKVFEVDEINFAANAEKNLIVRMSSWRGRYTISGEWKECDYDGAMVEEFLEDLVQIMLFLIDENKDIDP